MSHLNILWRTTTADLLTGTELRRNTEVRYCKTCKLAGKKVPINTYNKRDECERHPPLEKVLRSLTPEYIREHRSKRTERQRKKRKQSAV